MASAVQLPGRAGACVQASSTAGQPARWPITQAASVSRSISSSASSGSMKIPWSARVTGVLAITYPSVVPGGSHGGHRDPAGPFPVEGGQRLPPALRDGTLDQVPGRVALALGPGCLPGPLGGALVLDVDDTQPQQLHQGIIGGGMSAGLHDFPHLPVERLYRIPRVN